MTTVYVGNVDMSVTHREIYGILSQYIQRDEIINVARSLEVIFITLVNRKAAQHIFDCLQGKNFSLPLRRNSSPLFLWLKIKSYYFVRTFYQKSRSYRQMGNTT